MVVVGPVEVGVAIVVVGAIVEVATGATDRCWSSMLASESVKEPFAAIFWTLVRKLVTF